MRAALHFSDTSGASKHSSAAATKDAYTEGINPVFVATTVPGLCGQLKAFKKAVRHKRAKPTDPDGLGLNRPGMNLHFFRTGISPTWEDPYNEKVSFPILILFIASPSFSLTRSYASHDNLGWSVNYFSPCGPLRPNLRTTRPPPRRFLSRTLYFLPPRD